jgi:hypothetical protein
MERRRRIAAAATFSTLLVAGTIGGFMLTTGTATASTTEGTPCTLGAPTGGTPVTSCTIGTISDQLTINQPLDIFAQATATQPASGGDTVTLNENFICEDDDLQETGWQTGIAGAISLKTANADVSSSPFNLLVSTPVNCQVYVTASDTAVVAGDQITVSLEYDPNPNPVSTVTATASPTPTTTTSTAPATKVYQVHGFDGTCVDDFGDSSSERAKIGIWTCSSTDTAQSWSYSGDELKIHGDMCINAKGNGKSGSKLILWPCNGSANEVFVHNSKQEYVEKAGGWKYCIDDPAYSTKNGTQLFVYSCNSGPNQHWSLP